MIGRYGASVGKILTGKTGAYNVALMKTVPDLSLLDRSFFYHYLISGAFQKRLMKVASRSAQDGFSKEDIYGFPVPVPPLREQQQVINRIGPLSAEARRLESIYQKKLVALDELKKSLLHKAFAGELTGQSRQSVIIPFPTRIPNITPIELHAGILAIAHQLHEKKGKTKYFGHVKAEKIAHMIEAHVGIDLGRTPVKDAAGPNDFQHLRRVEHRAKKASYFDFQRVEKAGYRVTKYRQFEGLIERTRERLGDRSRDVDSMIELMLPMDTQQAEIFCTVYAAWNNLLLDRQQPTDESIVHEARENWHPDKLNILREKFFTAISWMKKKGVIPKGEGKKVSSKAKKKK